MYVLSVGRYPYLGYLSAGCIVASDIELGLDFETIEDAEVWVRSNGEYLKNTLKEYRYDIDTLAVRDISTGHVESYIKE